MSVSNFVNGNFQFMSSPTRERIAAAVERLNYRPHTAGRSLRLAERLTVGMIVLDESPTYLADPFTTHVVAGLTNALDRSGYSLVLQGLRISDLGNSLLVRSVRTDGFCLMLSGRRALRRQVLEDVLQLRQPIVLFQESLAEPAKDTCSVRQDDFGGGRLLARHLLGQGARRCLMLVPDLSWPAIEERVRGVKAVIRRRPGAKFELLACGDSSFQSTQAALSAHLAHTPAPEAIIGGNDQMGIAAMKLMKQRGLRVPEDIMITGFNAFDFWQYTDPMMTTVVSPAYEIGRRGAEVLAERLKSGAFETRDVVLPVSLQLERSTGASS
jgi:LacI family transcriptional regulator